MFVELEEFRRFMRKTAADTGEDDRLQEALEAAIGLVEHHIGGPLDHAARTFTVYPSGPHLVLSAARLTEVTEVTDPDGRLVPLEQVEINLLAGIVTLPYPPPTRRPYTVVASTREHGATIRLAVKITAAHLVATEPRGGVPGAGANRFTTTPGAEQAAAGFALPRRAQELIATARTVTVR